MFSAAPRLAGRVVKWSARVGALVCGVLLLATPASTTPLATNPGGYQVELLAAAPDNPSQVVAVADYFNAGWSTLNDRFGEYLLESADGGQTWKVSAQVPGSGGLLNVALVNGGQTILAISVQGSLIRSEDAGKTWTVVKQHATSWTDWPTDIGVTPLVTDPSRPGSAWVCSALNEGSSVPDKMQTIGVISSSNGGLTWQSHKVETSAKANGSCGGIAVTPGGRLVLAYGDASVRVGKGWTTRGTYLKLFRSSDGGAHWKRVPETCRVVTASPAPGCWAQSVMLGGGALFFDPRRPNVVIGRSEGLVDYAGMPIPGTGDVVYRSSDGGMHWKPAALVASLSNHGPGRVYSGSAFRLEELGRAWWFVDRAGHKLYPRFAPMGFYEVGANITSFNNYRVFPKQLTALQSSDHGAHWSLAHFTITASSAGPGPLVRGAVVVSDEILSLDGVRSPSILWNYNPDGRSWSAQSLGLQDAISPNPGHWSSDDGALSFYLAKDRSTVHALDFKNPNPVIQWSPDHTTQCSGGLGTQVTLLPAVLDPIAGSSFSYTGPETSISGKFDSATTAHGTIEMKGTDDCGPWDTGEVPWTASWRDSSQPSS